MSVLGWAKCEQCGQMVTAVVWWPSAADARKQVCYDCHAKLNRVAQQLQKLRIGVCPHKVAPATASPPPARPTRRYLMPAGCEYRFLFMWWMALTGRINEGLPTEALHKC